MGLPRQEDTDGLGWLLDQAAIMDVVNRLANAADARDWSEVRSCFADEVEVDHTSVYGGEAETVGSGELAARWREDLGGFDATQHLVANHSLSVSGNWAVCTAHVHAQHYFVNYHQGSDAWTLGLRYDYGLTRTRQGWKIAQSRVSLLWAGGNRHLPELARRRYLEGLGTGWSEDGR